MERVLVGKDIEMLMQETSFGTTVPVTGTVHAKMFINISKQVIVMIAVDVE